MARPGEVVYWYRLSWSVAIALVAPVIAYARFPEAARLVTVLCGVALVGLGIAAWRRFRDTMLSKPH
jgi:hypothetical protein